MADDNLSEQARLAVLAAYGDPDAMPSRERLTAAMSRLDAEVAMLESHQAAALSPPEADDVQRACTALRSAVRVHSDAELAADALSADRIQLLETSLEFRDRHGTQPCPVCAEGTLDDGWANRARAALADEQDAARTLRVARSGAHRARQTLIAVVRTVDEPPAEDGKLAAITTARVAYQSLSALPVGDDTALADHVAVALPELRTAYDALREEAASKLEIAREARNWLQALATAVQR